MSVAYSHGEVFNPTGCNCKPRKVPGKDCPKVLIAPPHYIQGPRILPSLGRYVKNLVRKCDTVGLLITAGGLKRSGDVIDLAFAGQGIEYETAVFRGTCSYEAVDEIVQLWGGEDNSKVKAVVAVGGGTTNDCGKIVAHRLGVPTVIVSTLAATDAPCSALSIMYTEEGGYKGGEVYPLSPLVVILDTDIVAKAGKRSLVSGFGDALSTYYEARTCFNNPDGLSMLEARPTMTALAIGHLCADMLYENALDAVAAVEAQTPNDALEKVVEANALLSGIGFESGGLAASHAVAQALSWVPSVHDNHMHGEMVAMGLLTMLEMEKRQGLLGRDKELDQVLKFLVTVGLPICHRQVHFDASDDESWKTFLDVCMDQWFCHNEPAYLAAYFDNAPTGIAKLIPIAWISLKPTKGPIVIPCRAASAQQLNSVESIVHGLSFASVSVFEVQCGGKGLCVYHLICDFLHSPFANETGRWNNTNIFAPILCFNMGQNNDHV